jgi:hypothetical protein
MMENGTRIMTWSPTSTTSAGFSQAILREPRFLPGQQMDIVASDSVKQRAASRSCTALIVLSSKNPSKNIQPQKIQATIPRTTEMIATFIKDSYMCFMGHARSRRSSSFDLPSRSEKVVLKNRHIFRFCLRPTVAIRGH